jgi:hypothetical protein
MKTFILKSLLAFIVLSFSATTASAQLGKLLGKSKAKTEAAADTTAVDSAANAIDWDNIPVYHAQLVNLTDEAGNPLLNEDGTQQTRVMLVDQFGNYRSQAAVDAQRKKLKKYIGNIVAKVGGAAAVGAVSGLLAGGSKKGTGAAIGAAAGVVAGLALSANDIKRARELHKSLKEQDKLMEAYAKNFTNEGEKVDAAANVESIDGLTIDKDAAVSKTAGEIKAIVDSEDFDKPAEGIWDSI